MKRQAGRQEDNRTQIDDLANAPKRIYSQHGGTDGNRNAKRKQNCDGAVIGLSSKLSEECCDQEDRECGKRRYRNDIRQMIRQ